ncbi:dienelactone hydrolase [Microbacterium sp. SYP-A9085]|uniref:alpha/beta hydrolase family protein n=1 Tax=Microbacterium sp. SYP-A9085 TaxID=2664454 RepID=UPI00129BA3B1|nr:alpha/beta family hydrolase [Microbacterium sp. SYP-A9085]MRH29701.1 dienelactone hydrolase [Microbacterium sp. SYP-A9085]
MIRELAVPVPLPAGEVDIDAVVHEPAHPSATVIVAHGAGTRLDHPFLVGFATAVAAAGMRAVRFNFPYAQAGRRMPGPAAHAVAAWQAVVDRCRGDVPVHAAGRSYGGRMASMAAAEGRIRPHTLVYLGYPLHPPGRPDKLRTEHLPLILAPQLFVSGTRDPFVDPHGQLEDAVAACRRAHLHWVDGGGHGFEVAGRRRPADEIGAGIAAIALEWIAAQ